ncbi:hypothetical protein, partial [Nocardia sp. NPDC058497]|uniref:hypothetical protein n=1 Tax=Nocardia sp. NPDC058497 TaxID=3346529 RepID=UPI00366921C5
MPFRHTAPPSAGRPSGMRSDRHESRPMTSESSGLVAPQHTGSLSPAVSARPTSAAPAHPHSNAQPPADPATP